MSRSGAKSEIELYVINKVKELRIKAGLSQADLAIELDLSVGFIGHVESPKKVAKYNLNHINKLAKVLSCSPQDLLPKEPFN
jgi:transcriptional regulator with XRE-family HTH domain